MKKDLEDDLEMQFYEQSTGESAWKGKATEIVLVLAGLAALLLFGALLK